MIDSCRRVGETPLPAFKGALDGPRLGRSTPGSCPRMLVEYEIANERNDACWRCDHPNGDFVSWYETRSNEDDEGHEQQSRVKDGARWIDEGRSRVDVGQEQPVRYVSRRRLASLRRIDRTRFPCAKREIGERKRDSRGCNRRQNGARSVARQEIEIEGLSKRRISEQGINDGRTTTYRGDEDVCRVRGDKGCTRDVGGNELREDPRSRCRDASKPGKVAQEGCSGQHDRIVTDNQASSEPERQQRKVQPCTARCLVGRWRARL